MSLEPDLVRRAAAGDREAFDRLMAPRWPRLVGFAVRFLRDRDEAQDVAQQALLRIWEALPRFRPDEDLDAWCYRITVNLALDALRRRRTRPVASDLEAVASSHPADPAAGPETLVLARELEAALAELTAELAPRQRAVFLLCRVEGLASAQVAAALGISESTVRNTLFQLRGVLAARLKERFPGLLGGSGGSE